MLVKPSVVGLTTTNCPVSVICTPNFTLGSNFWFCFLCGITIF